LTKNSSWSKRARQASSSRPTSAGAGRVSDDHLHWSETSRDLGNQGDHRRLVGDIGSERLGHATGRADRLGDSLDRRRADAIVDRDS
jgi:hypothetical protein